MDLERYRRRDAKLRNPLNLSVDDDMAEFINKIKVGFDVPAYLRDQLRKLKEDFDKEKQAG